jgi:hypothetical protein
MSESQQDEAATACAARAAREAAARPPKAAPLPPAGFAVAGPGRDDATGRGEPATTRRPERTREHCAMSDEAELEHFRASVNCAAVLETMGVGWKLDARESTRRALKYRRGEGEILIINHDGRGWWDPLSCAKGDVFDLVQHLDPRLNFGRVRQVAAPPGRRGAGLSGCTSAGEGEGGRPTDSRTLEPATTPARRVGCLALPG